MPAKVRLCIASLLKRVRWRTAVNFSKLSELLCGK